MEATIEFTTIESRPSTCSTNGAYVAFMLFLRTLSRFIPQGTPFEPQSFTVAIWQAYVAEIQAEAAASGHQFDPETRRQYLEAMVTFVRTVQSYGTLSLEMLYELETQLPGDLPCVLDRRIPRCRSCGRPAFLVRENQLLCRDCRLAQHVSLTTISACIDCAKQELEVINGRCPVCRKQWDAYVDAQLNAYRAQRARDSERLLRILVIGEEPWWTFSQPLVDLYNEGIGWLIGAIRRVANQTCNLVLDGILDRYPDLFATTTA